MPSYYRLSLGFGVGSYDDASTLVGLTRLKDHQA